MEEEAQAQHKQQQKLLLGEAGATEPGAGSASSGGSHVGSHVGTHVGSHVTCMLLWMSVGASIHESLHVHRDAQPLPDPPSGQVTLVVVDVCCCGCAGVRWLAGRRTCTSTWQVCMSTTLTNWHQLVQHTHVVWTRAAAGSVGRSYHTGAPGCKWLLLVRATRRARTASARSIHPGQHGWLTSRKAVSSVQIKWQMRGLTKGHVTYAQSYQVPSEVTLPYNARANFIQQLA